MKKIISVILTLLGFYSYSQTITTTTINGSLKVNDSLNVSRNIEAEDIKSRGEIVAQDDMRAEKDILVTGNGEIGGNLKVFGTSRLVGSVLTPTMLIGNATDNISISMQNLQGGKVLAFGFNGPIQNLPTTCIKPYNSSSLSIFNSRAGVVSTTSAN